MATLQSLNLILKPSSSHRRHRPISATLQTPTHLTMTTKPNHAQDVATMTKLYTIAESATDRAEMHAIIAQQRNNWGHLLLHSINSITLSASIMTGISATSPHHLLAFKLASSLLFAASTCLMLITDKIQPSQLAEEQRNAARLFRQLNASIHTSFSLASPTQSDVDDALARVLALDKAYPLPLLPGMLEKFPDTVEPAVWWPEFHVAASRGDKWSEELEDEMRCVLKVLKEKDTENYIGFGRSVLRVNRVLSVAGPVLAGAAAVAAAMVGVGTWAEVVGVVGGAMAAVVNTLQHGGQVGMVFELSRNCAGFYRKMEEEIEWCLGGGGGRRESGEVFEMRMALQLGRSVSELRRFAASLAGGEGIEEFAGKLF